MGGRDAGVAEVALERGLRGAGELDAGADVREIAVALPAGHAPELELAGIGPCAEGGGGDAELLADLLGAEELNFRFIRDDHEPGGGVS